MATPGAFLGTGWSFPPTFSAGGADVEMVSGPEDIEQSLQILLGTHSAERVWQPGFGCDLRQFLFAEIDRGLLNNLTSLITDAILVHEPRITLNGLDVAPDPDAAGRLLIQLDYTIRATNSRYNLVYPFYLNEATLPPA